MVQAVRTRPRDLRLLLAPMRLADLTTMRDFVSTSGLWLVFFSISFGLGYPTLNRYDPRNVEGLSDSNAYYALVVGARTPELENRAHRVLVPYVARSFYLLVRGRLGSWNPVSFSLLVSNSIFTATVAFILLLLGEEMIGNYSIALVGVLLFLLNYAVANLLLAGYVDSAQVCVLMAMTWALVRKRWWLLPILGLVGAMAKETSVPLAVAFALGWWVADSYARRGFYRAPLLWIATMALSGSLALVILMATLSKQTIFGFAMTEREAAANMSLWASLAHCFVNHECAYVFAWILPLGIWRLSHFPKTWIIASVGAAFTALAMGTYSDAKGNFARPLFDTLGPLLSLSSALFLCDRGTRAAEASDPASGLLSDR